MNKKVVLSVLSTAVVASMATSAFAAPKDGIYLGGNVKKYYSIQTLLDLNASAKADFAKHIADLSSNLNQVVYVDFDGKGASIQEILDEGLAKAKTEALVAADFADSYTVIKADGTTNGTIDPQDELGPVTGELKVESVSAINLKNAVIKFNKEVDTATVTTTQVKAYINGSAVAATVTVTPSTDKKSATVAFTSPTQLQQSDSVKFVVDGVKDANGVAAPKFEQTLTVTDVAAPTINSIEVVSNKKVKVYFSEPVNMDTAGIYKTTDTVNSPAQIKVDGSLSFAKYTAVPGENAVEVEFFNALANGAHTIEISEVKDFAGFKVAAKSFTVTTEADVTAPVATKAEAKGTGKVVVYFNEELKSPATGNFVVKETGNNTDLYFGGSKQLTTDKKGIELTLGTGFTAAASLGFTVTYDSVEDASGNKNTTAASLNGVLGDDTVKPELASFTVLANNKLELVFSEQVNTTAATFKLYKKGETTPVATYTNANLATAASAKANAYDLTMAYLTGKDAAEYDLKIEGVVDTSARKNAIDAKTVSFKSMDDLAPTVTAATLVADSTGNNDKVEVVFSEAMNTTDLANVANFFVGNGSAGVALSTVSGAKVESVSADAKKVVLLVPDADDSDATLNTFAAAVNKIAAPGLRDASGKFVSNATIAAPYTVASGYTSVSASDLTVEATGKNTIKVTALNGYSFTAADANAFKVERDGTDGTNAYDLGIVAAQISADGKSVTLTTSAALTAAAKYTDAGTDYAVDLYITGTGVKDQNGQVVAITAANSINVVDKIVATQQAPVAATGLINVAFDESVAKASGITDDLLAAAFELKTGGVTLTPVVDYTAAITTVSGKDIVQITVKKSGVVNADVTVELKNGSYLKDANGNSVTATAVATVSGVTEKQAPNAADNTKLTIAATQVSGAAGAVEGGATVKIVADGAGSGATAVGTATAATDGSFAAITGLTTATAYDVYVIDAAGNVSAKLDITTP